MRRKKKTAGAGAVLGCRFFKMRTVSINLTSTFLAPQKGKTDKQTKTAVGTQSSGTHPQPPETSRRLPRRPLVQHGRQDSRAAHARAEVDTGELGARRPVRSIEYRSRRISERRAESGEAVLMLWIWGHDGAHVHTIGYGRRREHPLHPYTRPKYEPHTPTCACAQAMSFGG